MIIVLYLKSSYFGKSAKFEKAVQNKETPRKIKRFSRGVSNRPLKMCYTDKFEPKTQMIDFAVFSSAFH